MSTYPTCSECGKILWELAEREGKMCEKCQKENWRNHQGFVSTERDRVA